MELQNLSVADNRDLLIHHLSSVQGPAHTDAMLTTLLLPAGEDVARGEGD